MTYSNQCGICLENYTDTEESKPRILPCGHSYCHKCLQEVQLDDKICPACRGDWSHCELEGLPVCFQLLPEAASDLQPAKCLRHKFALTFSCRTCERKICRKCVISSHEHCTCAVLDESVEILREEVMDDLDKQEGECNTVLASTEQRSMEITNERLHVKQLTEGLMEYDKTMLNQQDAVEKIKKDVMVDILAIEQKRSSIIGDNSEGLVGRVFVKSDLPRIKNIGNLPKTNLSVMVQAFANVYDETTIPRFVASFKNRLDNCLNEAEDPSKKIIHPDQGKWEVKSCTVARSCLGLLKSTSFRPKTLIVTVAVPWARSTLETFLTTVAILRCDLQLNFVDSMGTPTQESAAENERRLNFLKRQHHRCVLTSFIGHVSEDVAKVLLDIATDQRFDLTMVLKQSHDMSALRLITTSSKYRNMKGSSAMELCIPRDADVDSFTELPPLRANCAYTLSFPRLGNSDLCWMLTAVNILSKLSSSVDYIMLPESSVTESGLDRFLGHLLDHGITHTPPIYVISPTIDQSAQIRIQNRYTQHGHENLIRWEKPVAAREAAGSGGSLALAAAAHAAQFNEVVCRPCHPKQLRYA